MNPTTELYGKVRQLRIQRAVLLGSLIGSLMLQLILGLQPSPVRDLQKENGILRRYALRLEDQNAQKDRSFIKLVEKMQGYPVRFRK